MDRRLVSQLLLVGVVALVQNFSWLSLGGVKVNLTLIVLLALAFVARNMREYLLLVGEAIIILQAAVRFDFDFIIFAIVVTSAYLLRFLLPWQSLVNYLIFVIVATTAFYAVIDWQFLQEDFLIFFQELIYNLVFGGLIYLILIRNYEEARVKF